MPEYTWYESANGNLWWLRPSSGGLSVGLMDKERMGDDIHKWRVAAWQPSEKIIAHLPAELTTDEALDAAKMLILLSLKQTESEE
jgi:hypothetical protein